MLKLVKIEATSFCKCQCCGESIRKCEKYLQVQENGKNVRGERYCVSCEEIAWQDHDFDAWDKELDCGDDGERMLRQMEDYAAYSAAGCTSEYWSDRDNGYCS